MLAAGVWLGGSSGAAAAIAGSVAVGVLVTASLVRRLGPSLPGAALLACVCGGGLGYETSIATRLRAGAIVDIGVAEAPLHPEATLFRFRDGRVLAYRAGYYQRVISHRNSTTRLDYFVAPLVPDAWKEGDPVPAWVATQGSGSSWVRPWRCGARLDVPADADNGYRAAIRECTRKGLTELPGAPILEWIEDADAWPAQRVHAGCRVTAGLFCTWYVVLIFFLGYRFVADPIRGRGRGMPAA